MRNNVKNVVAWEYFKDNRRFAEVCCHGLFGGKMCLDPESLRSVDSTEALVQGILPEEIKTLWKDRDIIKECRDGTRYVLLGIENQSEMHYCMPLRCLVYDTLNYEEQRLAIAREHRRKKDLKDAEYISEFARNDRLTPVFTLVLYFGEEEWDTAETLKELLDIPEDMQEFEDRLLNYRINLLDVRRIPDLEQYRGDLKAVFGFIKYQKDKTALWEFVMENEKIFSCLDLESAQAIAVLGNAGEMERVMKKNRKKKNREETVDVCQALREMMEDARTAGREEGREVGRREEMEKGIHIFIEDNLEEGVPLVRIREKLRRRYGLTDTQAEGYLVTHQN